VLEEGGLGVVVVGGATRAVALLRRQLAAEMVVNAEAEGEQALEASSL
jgi:hypothetical protein